MLLDELTPAGPPCPYPFTPLSVEISTVNPGSFPGSGWKSERIALYSG